MNLNKIATTGSFITLGIAFVFLVTTIFWMTYPYRSADVKSAIVLDNEVKAGGLLTYELDYCKHMELPAVVTRAFVDGIVFTAPEVVTNNPAGCNSNTHLMSVPAELPSGEYYLRTTWEYQVNPLRKVLVTFTTNSFKITGSDKDRQENQE
jgi:hypothetical protein